jgi:hypothetical protein
VQAAATPSASASPLVRIVSPSSGTSIGGNVVFVRLAMAPPYGERAYVLVDVNPPPAGQTIPVAHGIVWSESADVPVPGMTDGTHRLTAVFGDALRLRGDGGSDTVSVRVGGPTLVATAPGTSVEGDPWTITVTVNGVRLVPPSAGPSPGTGHLEFFIDHDLPPLGQPIPADADYAVPTNQTTVPLTGLSAGEHFVWVLVADGARNPFDPYVADLVRVTVTM